MQSSQRPRGMTAGADRGEHAAPHPTEVSRQAGMLTILVYNEPYISIPQHIDSCPVEHTIVFDRSYLDRADAVLFHIPTLESNLQVRKRPGQRWVALSAESEMVCLRMRNEDLMRQFDFTMTYRLDSDFPMPYVWPDMVHTLLSPPWQPAKTGHTVCFMSGAADLSFRESYVRELMHYIPVHSFGKVLHNQTLLEDAGRTTKLDTIARYRFTLAFENSIADDYVTEKFFDPLLVGSVPVYLGSKTVERLSPADGCYINVADFSGPRDLAGYLNRLASDEAAYSDYLSWKHRPLRPSFIQLAEGQHLHPIGRLCLYLAGDLFPISVGT